MSEQELINGLLILISILGFILITSLLIKYKLRKKDVKSQKSEVKEE